MPQPNKEFTGALLAELETGWRAKARPNQLPPDEPFSKWLILAGRGFGKTRSGAEWISERAISGRARRIAIAAPTVPDVRDVCIEGQSGVLACSPPWCMPVYEPSKRRLTWPNGCMATTFGADRVDALRGPQFDTVWCDELASWRRPQTFDMIMFGLRLNDAMGDGPQACITTTPRPTALIRSLLSEPGTVVTRGTSYENRDNLAPSFFARIVRKYEGTRLGRQELNADLLDDVAGSLWQLAKIDELRRDVCPPLRRVVVAIDPSGSGDPEADECGIVVAGLGADDHGYVLADLSGRYSPNEWARIAIAAYHAHGADRIIAEQNFGAGMVEAVLRGADANIPYRAVVASRGKVQRAEPISSLYEQSRVHHVGVFSALEDELTLFSTVGYMGNGSPGRADGLVWALSDLMTAPMSSYGIYELYRQQAEALPQHPADNRQAWRRQYDEQNARVTPNHPDCAGDEPEWVNGPMCLLPRVDNMMVAIAQERARFAAITAERLPTADEVAEHVCAIDRIREGRNA
ncbi:MAG TPA: terminase family protein [Stellaceae bacterium]|jgi:phage terminase large subunit-like protein|nr:terminase family protein [Stellaceae bacterium]